MIRVNGKRVLFYDDNKVAQLALLRAETQKHKGKSIENMSTKEKTDTLRAALALLGVTDFQGIVK